jgi:homoserine dehydrogenase
LKIKLIQLKSQNNFLTSLHWGYIIYRLVTCERLPTKELEKSMRKINIGLLGCGTVGTGVAKLLIDNKNLLTARVGAHLNLKWVADLDTETDRGIRFPDGVFIKEAQKVISDPDIDIVIEMIGGEDIAKDFILKAVENGKHIVTANKALLAGHGNKLFAAAAQKGVDLAFEASGNRWWPIISTQ